MTNYQIEKLADIINSLDLAQTNYLANHLNDTSRSLMITCWENGFDEMEKVQQDLKDLVQGEVDIIDIITNNESYINIDWDTDDRGATIELDLGTFAKEIRGDIRMELYRIIDEYFENREIIRKGGDPK